MRIAIIFTCILILMFQKQVGYTLKPSLKDLFGLIMPTCPFNVHSLTPHFYIVKLGFKGVYIVSLFLLQNIDCGYSLEPPH